MDKRRAAVIAVLCAVPLALLVIWAYQGKSMEADFVERLRADDVKALHRDLRGKQWSAEELATVHVMKVPADTGPQRALVRAAHSRGQIVISSIQYAYQGTVRDNTTGIVHVFGYRRSEPKHWCWVSIHPDSMREHLQRRMEELEQMEKRARSD